MNTINLDGHSPEVIGTTCIDGGKCYHYCEALCFRRECCAPLSGYTGPWQYAAPEGPPPAPPGGRPHEATASRSTANEPSEVAAPSRCTSERPCLPCFIDQGRCDGKAVPEPEPAAFQVWAGVMDMAPVGPPFQVHKTATEYAAQIKSVTEVRSLVYLGDARSYGAACHAAGEAAGYARGLAEAGRDAERLDYIERNARCDPKMDGQHVWWPTNFSHRLIGPTIRDAIDAALRGEVKPHDDTAKAKCLTCAWRGQRRGLSEVKS